MQWYCSAILKKMVQWKSSILKVLEVPLFASSFKIEEFHCMDGHFFGPILCPSRTLLLLRPLSFASSMQTVRDHLVPSLPLIPLRGKGDDQRSWSVNGRCIPYFTIASQYHWTILFHPLTLVPSLPLIPLRGKGVDGRSNVIERTMHTMALGRSHPGLKEWSALVPSFVL